jgi:hypothetical protein
LAGEEPRKSRAERLAAWAVSQPVVSLTLAGAALYLLVRLGQQLFYEQFGLAPEDVGLGYAETLARAAGFTASIALVIVPVALLYAWVMRKLGRMTGSSLAVMAIYFYASLLLTLVALVGNTALLNAYWVKRGDSVQSFFVLDIGLRGEPAEIAWLEGAPETLAGLEDHELMLLDNSGGTVTLYDVTDERTVQIPSSSVAVSITHQG